MNRDGYVALSVVLAFLLASFAIVSIRASLVSADEFTGDASYTGLNTILSSADKCTSAEEGLTRCKGNSVQECQCRGWIWETCTWGTTKICKETDPVNPKRCRMITPPDNNGDGKPDGPPYAMCVPTDKACGGDVLDASGNSCS